MFIKMRFLDRSREFSTCKRYIRWCLQLNSVEISSDWGVISENIFFKPNSCLTEFNLHENEFQIKWEQAANSNA